ncbi:MAG TPA: hypothetical protein VGW34_06810 [Allosphingosinicella sp.]|nr:hypothetical protein [Allosphingosinicella sp.]
MTGLLKKAIAGAALVSGAIVAAAPAEAHRWHRYRHHGGDSALAAGLIGLGIGAAIASSHHGYYGGGYYAHGYYPRYYGRGYYRHRYPRRCFTRWEYDPYWGRPVRVRYC